MNSCFALFGLTETFELDSAALEKAYFAEQRKCHPDRFINKPALEKQAAASRSVDLNNAYNTLKHPLKRAQHILALHGITVGSEKDNVKPSQELLMETLEWREEIEHDSVHPDKLDTMEELLRGKREASLNVIARECNAQLWDAMAQETLRLGYIDKALEDIQAHRRKQQKAS